MLSTTPYQVPCAGNATTQKTQTFEMDLRISFLEIGTRNIRCSFVCSKFFGLVQESTIDPVCCMQFVYRTCSFCFTSLHSVPFPHQFAFVLPVMA